jgi:hypothetical protein
MIVGLLDICMPIPFWNAFDGIPEKLGLFRKLRTGALSALTSNVVNIKSGSVANKIASVNISELTIYL